MAAGIMETMMIMMIMSMVMTVHVLAAGDCSGISGNENN